MERDSYNPYNFESSGEKSDDKKDEKKKKSATGLARLIAREEAAQESRKEPEKDDRSVFQKLKGEPKPEVEPDKTETSDEDAIEADQDVQLEELEAEEEVAVAEMYLEGRIKQLATETRPGDATAEEAAETKADRAFLEAVQERLAEEGEGGNIDEALEAAFADVTVESADEEDDEDAGEVSDEPLETKSSDEEPLGPQEFDPDQPVPLNSGGTGRGRGHGGGSGRPPIPPVPPASPLHPRPGGPSGRGFSSPVNFSASTPNVAPKRYDDADVQRFERSAMARGLLVGGVIGYLMGRRRGRINAEKRFKTVQDKLEKQVVGIQQKIEQKEVIIRKMARERVVAVTVTKPAVEKAPVTPAAPEITRPAPERVAPEARSPERTSAALRTPEATKDTVENLSKEELLAYSAQIKVGETSLRRVYEAKLVDEKGLRRLIREYQAGHDLRRALAREFMMKELKFERDPSLRDLLPPEAQPRKQGESKGQSSDYGGRATAGGSNDGGAAEPTAMPAGPTNKSIAIAGGMAKRAAKNAQKNVSPLLLIGLTLVTIGLALYAIWLTATK